MNVVLQAPCVWIWGEGRRMTEGEHQMKGMVAGKTGREIMMEKYRKKERKLQGGGRGRSGTLQGMDAKQGVKDGLGRWREARLPGLPVFFSFILWLLSVHPLL